MSFEPNTVTTDSGGTTPDPLTTHPAAQSASSHRPPFSLEWASGFVDGEGCISILRQIHKDRRWPTYAVSLSVSQNELAVLEHLHAGLGEAGRIYKVARKRQHKRQVYTLNVTGIRALKAIEALRPYFVRKGPEADAVWAFWREARGGERPGGKGWPPELHALRERFYLKLRKLK